MREAAIRGFWMSSRAPYGYTKVMVQDGAKKRPVLEPNPVTAPAVQRMFEMIQAGKGILDITRTLTEEGIANPTGRLWSKTGIHNILCNEVYTGTMTWGESTREKAEPVRVEKAFPAIISKNQFRRVNKQMRSRAPKKAHPRRVGSTYLLSGLVKCKQCRRALSGQDSKSGKFSYYVCQSLMKRGTGACRAPRLNARRFEELVVGQIRSNILTEGNIRDLVSLSDGHMCFYEGRRSLMMAPPGQCGLRYRHFFPWLVSYFWLSGSARRGKILDCPSSSMPQALYFYYHGAEEWISLVRRVWFELSLTLWVSQKAVWDPCQGPMRRSARVGRARQTLRGAVPPTPITQLERLESSHTTPGSPSAPSCRP